MPYCPNCTTEYTTGARNCADCGATLVDTPPEGWQATGAPEATRPVEVMTADNLVELDLVEAQLRAAGIPTARRPRRVALFVSMSNYEAAQRAIQGKSSSAASDTLGLSELHHIRLVCEECERPTDVDLLTGTIPDKCECGRFFDLVEARDVLTRYTEVMRMMAEADYEIEVIVPPAMGEE